ncbi:type II toxin-antitoxin system VapB family antitoxin [Candidatus Electronema sp. PJ]|uniref:type II toxin-antitoxin system VapB family antitoxin n=1 Tax=Candidatus Electronema sp. PJ TaxID=3401572 RepID=UPI003AA7E744
MRTTLNLPEELLHEAMQATRSKTKTSVVMLALEELVRKATSSELKKYKGKIDLDINLDELRGR